MKCRICYNSQNNITIHAKEMMFGFKTSFEYFECAACGCLQIKEYLKDSSLYYPESYYSISTSGGEWLKNKIKGWRNRLSFQPRGILGFFVNHLIPENRYQSLRSLNSNKAQAILDIGCGSGEMLQYLNRWGFTNLTGIDPFIPKDIIFNDQLKVYKRSIYELEGKYDFIMMHHAFEHMQNPEQVLKILQSHLSEEGTLLIRIPVGRSYAFETYKANWVQLDAPRHLYLHTHDSILILCERNNLKISKVIFDSMPFQFWGSEMYKDNVALISNTGTINVFKTFLKYRLFHNYASHSRKLNKQSKGDQAAFYIKKSY